MSFDRSWLLVLLLLPAGWLAWEYRRGTLARSVALKIAAFAVAILAGAGPSISYRDHRVAVAALLDASASITGSDLQRERDLLGKMQQQKGSSVVSPISFARNARGTNLEAPLRDALAALPSGTVHRIVLVSDGNENQGSVTRAAWQARQLGVPVDTISLNGRSQSQLRTISVVMPASVFSGESFPIELTVFSPRAALSTITLSAEGKSIGVHQVNLIQGENQVRLRTSLNADGAVELRGRIEATGLGDTRFENALVVKRAKVLWISNDPEGSESHIAGLLSANQFDVVKAKELPDDLSGAQLLVFNNDDMNGMDGFDKQRVEDFVKTGGGALWIAGDHNVWEDHKNLPEDAIERTFPAKLAPPKAPDSICVVLIIDKSASMEGRKIELARLSAIGVVENLRPKDDVGVLMFDHTFQWAVPIRKADNKPAIKALIAGITPDGGTDIASALAEAYKLVAPLTVEMKHIVLLTDGISEEGTAYRTAQEALNHQITISTVGLGSDVLKPYLTQIATLAKGRSYFLDDPAGLEQLLLKDVQDHTGTTAVEKPVQAGIKHVSELTDQIPLATAPALAGYMRFEPKPAADEILEVGVAGAKKDPLLLRWQYGLGRSAIFTSDAKSRWAANWLAWPGFDKLWTNVFRDLLPHSTGSESAARFDPATEEIVVDYHLSKQMDAPVAPPKLFVIGPGDFRQAVEPVRVSTRNYRAHVAIGSREGLFRIRPLADSVAFPEVGLYRPESELSEYGSNDELLRSLAQSTGGRFNPTVAQMFDPGGRYLDSTLALWPGLLSLALLLNFTELVIRKWRFHA